MSDKDSKKSFGKENNYNSSESQILHKKGSSEKKRTEKNSIKKKKIQSTVPVEKIKWNSDSVFKENKYYTRISFKFKLCKYITAVLTLTFTVVMLTVFSADITSENFQYLIKDLDLTGLTSEGNFGSIVFNGGTNSKFGIYRNELAVINSGQTSLYSASGAFSFGKSNIFYSPELLVSDKYILVYDLGNTTCSYSIYNSFAELKHEKFDYPIIGASLSESGSYVILSKDSGFKGVLSWYDKDFKLIKKIQRDKYIISSALSPDGNNLIFASIFDVHGSIITELISFSAQSDKPSASVNLKDVMPMKIQYTEDENIAVMYTDRIVFYNTDLEVISEINLSSLLDARIDVGKDLVCVVNNNNLVGNDKTLNIYNSEGKLIHTSQFSGELLKIHSFKDNAYLVLEDKISKIDLSDNSIYETEIEPNSIDLVFTSTGLPVICYAGKAAPVIFETRLQLQTENSLEEE